MKISIKNFFLITFILLEFVSVMAFAGTEKNRNAYSPESELLRPRITLSFVIARNRDCEGFGICDPSIGISKVAINSCTGLLFVDDYNTGIVNLEIDKATGLSRESFAKYFGTGYFLMEDNVPLPAGIVRELGLSGSKTLIAGKYKVSERNGIVSIAIVIK